MQSPDDIYARFNRSVALYELGRYQEAIVDFEQVESRLPSRMLWYQIEPILAYYKIGNFQRVFSLSDKIINNNNKAYSELYFIRGEIYKQDGPMRFAQTEYDKANQFNTSQFWKVNVE